MALTQQEQDELRQLEAELGNSVMNPNRPQPTLLQQFGRSVVETLPELGGMAGGAIGGLLTRTPAGMSGGSVLGSQAIRSMIGAGLGGALGEAGQQAITGRPSVGALIRGGIEQALYDGTGNLIISYGGQAVRLSKEAVSKFFSGKPPEDAVLAAQKLLQESGGNLTQFQATGDSWAGFKESVARGSFTGRPIFEKAAEANVQAIQASKKKILDEVTTRIYDSVQTGKEFAGAIEQGDAALKSLTRPFYEALANAPKIAQAPVNISPLKQEAQKVLEAANASQGLTIGTKERQYLESVAGLGDNISFAQAHEIASSLKTTLRDLKRSTEPDSKTTFRLTKLVKDFEDQMDLAGSKFTGTAIPFEGRIAGENAQTLADQYKFYSKFYRDSITDLYSDTAAKLLDKDPEFVGKTIFQNGNVTAWKEATQALKKAKQLDANLNVEQTIESVRRGYLENLLKSDSSFANLGEKLKNDEALRRTFETVLPKDVQKRVFTLLDAAKMSEQVPSSTAPLFFAAQQAQTIGALGSVLTLAVSDEARSVAADNPIKTILAGGVVLLGPRFWAKAATSPEATNATLGLLSKQKSGEPIGKNLMLKTTQAFEKVGITAEDMTAQSETKSAPVGLTPAEQEELQKLEAELTR